jgi:hypothetical protein
MFVVYHMSWDRKPSGSSLIFDGSFQTWNEALKCAFENILNGDIDIGEIPDPDDPPRKIFSDPVPECQQGIQAIFPNIQFEKYVQCEFTEFRFAERCYHVVKV